MGRGKKKGTAPPPEPKGKEPVFRPFADALKGVSAPPGAKPAPAPAPTKASTKPAPPVKKEKSDEELLRESMVGVRPLSERQRERVRTRAKEEPVTTPPFDEETEVLAKLAALVDGDGPLELEHSDEHSEWIADDADTGILQRLVAGEFAWQGHIDLHGLTRDPARDALVRFFASSRQQGFRCVLVVHGRGHNSEDGRPVLKPLVQRWLQRAPLKSWVFAYATAKPVDGGTGAMYVLLRR